MRGPTLSCQGSQGGQTELAGRQAEALRRGVDADAEGGQLRHGIGEMGVCWGWPADEEQWERVCHVHQHFAVALLLRLLAITPIPFPVDPAEFNETYAVADRLKEVDERFSLTQYCTSALGAAQGLDQRVTGGKLEPAVLSAYDMGLQMVGYVIAKYEEAKKKEDETKVDTAKEVPKKEAPREKEAKQAPEVAAPETATA